MASPKDSFSNKLWAFISDLTLLEAGLGVAAFVVASAPFLWWLWRVAHRRGQEHGRRYEKDHGEVRDLLRELDRERHERRIVADRLDRAIENNRVLLQNAEATRSQEIDLPADVQDVLWIRQEVVKEGAQIWSLRDAKPLAHLRERLIASPVRVVTVGNLKGGVGKTTLTANLAAFFEKRLKKKVLVIDLDYQGSLSATMLRAVEKTIDFSRAEHLLSGNSNGRNLVELAGDLRPKLPNSYIIPAGYTLQDAEDQLMMRWLFHTTDKDVRFNLAEVLLSPEVQGKFDVVLLDTGPRLTTASISALCASTHLIVPTNLDMLAVETVGSLLRQVSRIRSDLGLAVELAGIVGTMTNADTPNGPETDALGTIRERMQEWWPNGHLFYRTIPHTAAISNVAGTDIGYLVRGRAGKKVRDLFNALGQEVATRIGLSCTQNAE